MEYYDEEYPLGASIYTCEDCGKKLRLEDQGKPSAVIFPDPCKEYGWAIRAGKPVKGIRTDHYVCPDCKSKEQKYSHQSSEEIADVMASCGNG